MVGSFLPNLLIRHISLSFFKQCIFIAHRSVTRFSYCLRQKRRGKKLHCKFLGAFVKLRKTTIRFVMSVRPSVCLSVQMGKLGSHWTDFHEIWYFSIFRTPVEKIQVSLKSDNNNRYFTWRPIHICANISLFPSYNEKFSDKICREKENTHFMFNNFFFSRIMPIMR